MLTPAVITLAATLSLTCPTVESYRAQGYTNAQIEQLAVEKHVPRWVIAWAKRHCKSS